MRISVYPRIGIGPVKLGEKHSAVNRALGTPHLERGGTYDGWYRYRSGSIRIEVSYDTNGMAGRVDSVDTTSRAALIYGHPLIEGLTNLTPIFKSHGWLIDSCSGGVNFTYLEPAGPGTGIRWKNGRLDYVQIDAGGSVGEGCFPLD